MDCVRDAVVQCFSEATASKKLFNSRDVYEADQKRLELDFLAEN